MATSASALQARGRLYDRIAAAPGISRRELLGGSEVAEAVGPAQLEALASAGHILEEKGRDAVFYFPRAVRRSGPVAGRLGGSPSIRDVLIGLLERPGSTDLALAADIGRRRAAVRLDLRALVAGGVVGGRRVGGEERFEIVDRRLAGEILLVPRGVLGRIEDRTVEVWSEVLAPG